MLREGVRGTRAYFAISAFAALGLLVGGIAVVRSTRDESGAPSAASLRAGAAVSKPIERQQALAIASSLSAEVPKEATLDAKKLTWGEIRAGQDGLQPVPALNDDATVWAVSVSGGFVPEFARGAKFEWGLILIDPISTEVVGTLAGNGNVRAPAFDSSADLAS